MAISNSTLKATFGGKTDGTDKFTAAMWDSFLQAADTTLNALVENANSNGASQTTGGFYVNGELTTPTNGKITLAAFGGTGYPDGGYILSGVLTGQVVIGSASDNPTDDTQILLKGVTITDSSADNAAIMYMPAAQTLRVTLAKDVLNTLVCSNAAEIADSQKGCIWSENNMVIQGNGYLACKNMGGHGVKASELRFWGNPHIYVYASHDALHGNAEIDLCGGVYYVAKANDAFGTRAESGTSGSDDYKAPGKIMLFKADIRAYNLIQNVLDSKAAGYIIGENYSIQTDTSANSILSGMTIVDPQVYFGGAVWDSENNVYSTAASGSVKCYTDSDLTAGETEVTAVDGVYTLTTAFCKISGYIDGKIVSATKSTDIHVAENDKAYVTGNIEYTSDKKKIGIYTEKGSILVVAGDIVSYSNLAIEAKSGSFCNVKGKLNSGDITVNDTKGVVMVNGDVIGKILYVGTDEDNTGKLLVGAFLVDGAVTILLNSKKAKGNISVLKSGLVGVFCADSLNVASISDLNGSEHVFYHSAKGIIISTPTKDADDYIEI